MAYLELVGSNRVSQTSQSQSFIKLYIASTIIFFKHFKGTINFRPFHPQQKLEFKPQHHSRVNFHFVLSEEQKTPLV